MKSYNESPAPCSSMLSRVFALEVIERQAAGDPHVLATHRSLTAWHGRVTAAEDAQETRADRDAAEQGSS